MFAEVLLNHAYSRKQKSFVYEIPEDLNAEIGSGVVVPFRNKKEAGIILKINKQKPEFQTKEISQLLDPNLLLKKWQLDLIKWISEYYFCSEYDALRLFLPKHIWRVPKRERARKKDNIKNKSVKLKKLNKEQKEIVDSILNDKPGVSLIHGITGSGKTEIYKQLINAKIAEGKQALLLVPEISLTPQLLKYFEEISTDTAVIHSRLSDGKRAENWRKIYSGECKLIIGSRSAMFSPFHDLGIIIMDEEHEWTYKQDQSPRYHARDLAKKMRDLLGCQVVLGSATPSIESMYNAKIEEYKLFTIKERFSGTELPKVEIVDMREELKGGNYSMFSYKLEQKISSTLEKKEQIILFLNRRGSASATVCRDCGLAISCKNCDTKLTYHARKLKHKTLICHHCGIIEKMQDNCANCKSTRIKHFGTGTEKVESELRKLFPTARIHRADRDTMSKKDSFDKLHKALNAGEIDILVGTQMIGKGFDIAKVSLVGVILADMGLHIPDFRASERSFQLLTQVAGRSGRRETQGDVFIQTYNPGHPSLVHSKKHDYDSFYEQEISAREAAILPPFCKIIKLIHVTDSKEASALAAQKLKAILNTDTEHKIYSSPALIPRINNKYYWHIIIEGPTPSELIKANKEALENWRIDVDPVHTV